MASVPEPSKPKVYRLRNLPGHVDRQLAAEILVASLRDITTSDVRIASLASAVAEWTPTPSKTATLVFSRTPIISAAPGKREWNATVPALAKPLIIDDHFRGITPLNDVPDGKHTHDALVLSGLASHPIGSWQPRGDDKSFMWIRDDLTLRFPGIRFMLYGYDTTLVGSKSFQTVFDLASALVQTVKGIGWTSSTAKDVIFLTHSLGGVVLKKAVVLLAGGGVQEQAILMRIKGAVFFGVPSQAMGVPDIAYMIKGQPNEVLVNELAGDGFLSTLEAQFSGITFIERTEMFWAFETKVTSTVMKSRESGTFARTGPDTIMVSKESATRGLCLTGAGIAYCIPIDENHSNMVKFGWSDPRIDIIADKVQSMCSSNSKFLDSLAPPTTIVPDAIPNPAVPVPEQPVEESDTQIWDDDSILESLRAPERDRRLEQIDKNLKHTFEWAFDNDSLGLTQWLQEGEGHFWISGKPASGKSTFIKFLYTHDYTMELLRATKRKAQLVTCSFFFHHRGSNFQKSFDGLLASIVSQILESQSSLRSLLHSILEGEYRARVQSLRLSALRSDLDSLLKSFGVAHSPNAAHLVNDIVRFRPGLVTQEELKTLLYQAGVKPPPKPQEKEIDQRVLDTYDNFFKKFEKSTKDIADKEQKRLQIKHAVLAEIWTEHNLELALQTLIGQSLFDMDLVIFLDALDEYAGRPEFIASSIQSMVHSPAQSRTRIRVVFSSRPWPVFEKQFAACPTVRMHDHTAGDMLDYCAKSISTAGPTAQMFVSPLISTIVQRARGVFLWVRLVVRDLSAVATSADIDEVSRRDLLAKLKQVLDSLPDELDMYYRTIVERTSMATRWATYVFLETLRCSEVPLSRKDLRLVLDLSLDVIRPEVLEDHESDADLPEHLLAAATGGLVNVVPYQDGKSEQVQFAHQTVKEFVELPEFRTLVLGKSRADITAVNGNTFLARYHLINRATPEREANPALFIDFARSAEKTTGISEYAFFSLLPPLAFAGLIAGRTSDWKMPCIVATAVRAGLRLCLKDAYEADQNCIRNFPHEDDAPSLLSCLYHGRTESPRYDLQEANDIARWLASHGVVKIIYNKKEVTFLERFILPHLFANLGYPGHMESLGIFFLKAALSNPKDRPRIPQKTNKDPSPMDLLLSKILHNCELDLVSVALDLGADVNNLDMSKDEPRTPLDSIIDWHLNIRGGGDLGLEQCWSICKHLIQAGGTLKRTSRHRWEMLMKTFRAEGLDTNVLRPRWYEDSKIKRAGCWMGWVLDKAMH